MSEKILKDYIAENNNELPSKVEISSSVGNVQMKKNRSDDYEAIITQKNGNQFSKKIAIEIYGNYGEEAADSTELINKESPIPDE